MKTLEWQEVNVTTVDDLDPATRLRIAAMISGNFQDWRTLRHGYERVWSAIDNNINQFDPIHTPVQKMEKGMTIDTPSLMGSKLKMTNTFAHREGIVAAIMKFLMTNSYDFFDLVPLDPMDTDATMAIKEYLLYLLDVMDFETAFLPFLRMLVTYGTGIATYEWVKETGVRWKAVDIEDPLTQETRRVWMKANEVVYNAPKFVPLDLYNTVIDPTATDVKRATVIFQKFITPFEMMANTAYSVEEDWLTKLPDAAPDQHTTMLMERAQAQGNESMNMTMAYRGKKRVFEAWGDFVDNGIFYQNYVAEVAGDQLIRFEPNPYNMPHSPIIIARYAVEPGNIYGRSPLAAIAAIQSGFDTIVNQVIDANAMHNERPILSANNNIIQNAKTDNKTPPPLGKNVIWKVRDVQQTARMRDEDYEGVAQSLEMLPILDSQMKLATGDNELMSGGAGINDQYATTGHVVTVAEAGNSRFNMYSKTTENEAIVPMLEMTIDLMRQQNLDPKTFETKDMGAGSTVTFDPVMLANSVKFSMRGASYNATKQLQMNAMQQFYTLLAGNQMIAPIMNWVRVVVDYGEALGIRTIRNQIMPEAYAFLQQTPPQQPTWYGKVLQLFGGQQQKVMNNATMGQQFTQNYTTGFGGVDRNSTAPSPFDTRSQQPAA